MLLLLFQGVGFVCWFDKKEAARTLSSNILSTGTQTSSHSDNDSIESNSTLCSGNPIFERHFRGSTRRDHLSPLIKEGESRHRHRHRQNVFLLIGDSLDRKMLEYASPLFNGTQLLVDPSTSLSRPNACISSVINVGYLNIFGMRKPCDNGGMLLKTEPKPLDTSALRISVVLPDVFDLIPLENISRPIDVYVQIGSNLWDLTSGCNDQLGISPEYEQQYRTGIREVFHATQDTIYSYFQGKHISIQIHVLWKLAPPISMKYLNKSSRTSNGRVRRNQRFLNDILRDEVSLPDVPIRERL